MARRLVIAALLCAVLLGGVLLTFRSVRQETSAGGPTESTALPVGCRDDVFEADQFVVCVVEPSTQAVSLELTGSDGKSIEKLERLAKPVVFAMNAGMYHADLSPVGLYVEAGVERRALNRADAAGNFFLKPNGVFFIDRNGNAGVLSTDAYAATRPDVAFATQSGPMLVIDGVVHARFEPDGPSQHIRNGVGVDKAGRAVLAISRGKVSFGKFARLFQQRLGCRNALFLDGGISALYDGTAYIVGGEFPVGPVVVVRPSGMSR